MNCGWRLIADVRDAKLLQYLNEAYGKERELETARQGTSDDDQRKPYAKRYESPWPRPVATGASPSGGSSQLSGEERRGCKARWPSRRAKGPLQHSQGHRRGREDA